jgi:hypothetical protein
MKEYKANGEYIDYNLYEKFSSYINVPDNIQILSDTIIDKKVNILSSLSIIEISSILVEMCNTPENIKIVSQILLKLPINLVYSIIPTMILDRSKITIKIIVNILLNMPLSTISDILENMNLFEIIIFPKVNDKSQFVNEIKSAIISNDDMPPDKAIKILSKINPDRVTIILSNLSNDKASIILSQLYKKE